MYNPVIAASTADYYNTTLSAQEVAPSGVPYGFFPLSLTSPATPTPGYPLLISTSLTASRAAELLRALHDGGYLDAGSTEKLTLRLASYNPDLGVLAHWRCDILWGAGGTITATHYVQGSSATAAASTGVVLPVLLTLLVTCYCLVTIGRMLAVELWQRRILTWPIGKGKAYNSSSSSHLQQVKETCSQGQRPWPFWLAFEVILCLLMLAALAVTWVYAGAASDHAATMLQSRWGLLRLFSMQDSLQWTAVPG